MCARKLKKQAGQKLLPGFEDRQAPSNEKLALEDAERGDLRDEIRMLRVMMRRVATLAQGSEDLEEVRGVMGSLGLAATRLANLLITQGDLTAGSDQELAEAISRALAEIVEEMRKPDEQ